MAGITLKNVVKTYGPEATVIPGMDLEIRDKEFLILVGPSGCGKSTTLRMIAGLEEVSSGELYIGDRLVNDVAPKDRDIAMVFQSYALYPHMTVYKNMAFGLELRKTPKEEIDSKVREAAKMLDLERYLDRKPRSLSGGQRQRVALGRAMVRNPEVFLLDEPLSNLDARLRTEMRSQIGELHRRLQTTFVYVTHDQTEAMTMADRIAVLKDGVIQQADTPKKLYNEPCNMFVAGFIGSPQMNFIEARLEKGEGDDWYLNSGALAMQVPPGRFSGERLQKYAGTTIIVGIRPEDVISVDSHRYKESDGLIRGQVQTAEMTGAEVYLTILTSGGSRVMARVSSRIMPQVGDEITLAADGDKLHLFDRETEQAIR
ncbi:ABC transporter ATP-binding protein [Bacilliculturomica massiliensis]|uniref:ABC transporter ATP-binding protein n=1 Tax=Bacilliculturomica massiliensis TaxID=1917867 RepID=UPI0010301610|nr:sn-glycerol-3-phosphate ABC transporter ATP-binding protein UgpC [Bacilliculturomica massiliensis]